MPTFPTYRGELPQCLNPLNPRHYFLLLYWIFFRPTALKCYLYQANPDIYRSKMGKIVFQTRQIPAYYNLYIMMPIISILLAILLNLPVTLLTGQILGISVNWLKWSGGLTFGLLIGMVGGMAGGMMFCVAVDLATGITVGVETGILSSTATGVWVAATAGLGVSTMTGKMFGITAAILSGAIIGIAVGGTFSIRIGVMTGIMGGLTGGIMIGLILEVLSIVVIDIEFGVAAGVEEVL